MAHLGLKYLTAIVEEGDVQTFVKLRLPRKMFKAIEIELYDFIDQHVRKYGAIPAASTIESSLGDDVFEPVDEPPAFYADEVETRFIADSLKQHIKDVRSYLTADKMDPLKAFDIARESISDLQVTTSHQSILDFRDSRDVVIKEYKQKLTEGDDHGFYTGWPTLDNMTQGLGGGDVMSIVGRPAMGKTWKLLYSAHNAWKNHGKRVMLISMEMASTILAQRVISMHSHVALTQLKSAKLSKPLFDKMKAGFKEIEGYDQPFWIIDGNLTATTVDDVTLLAHQLKPDVILIDGAYLLRHPKIQRKHDRVDANAELIKYQLSSALDVPVIASYQFNREAAKLSKNKQEDVGLEHIGLTDSIGQLSSVVTGLFEDESIETIKRRWVQVLKGRSGETGGFYINWNFQMMDFDENDPSDEAEALQHL